MAATVLSFRGREHSDRRYAPSEHRLRERSPESITTAPAVATPRIHHTLGLWILGSLASRENRLASAPEWHWGQLMPQYI
jgi:hypothetical protein